MRATVVSFLFIVAAVSVSAAETRASHPSDWRVRLRVVDPDGKPLAGVAVWQSVMIHAQVSSEGYPDWLEISKSGKGTEAAKCINWTAFSGSVSNANGIIELGPLAAPVTASYTLYHPDFLINEIEVDGAKNPLNEKRVCELGDVKLAHGWTVSGVVFDPANRPVKDAWVSVKPSELYDQKSYKWVSASHPSTFRVGTVRSARTAADGSYTIRGLNHPNYLVAAWSATYPPDEIKISFANRNPNDLQPERANFSFENGQKVGVIVLEGDPPAPVSGASVNVCLHSNKLDKFKDGSRSLFGTKLAEGVTGADGCRVFDHLPSHSTFTISVGGPRGGWWCSNVTQPDVTETVHFKYGNALIHLASSSGKPMAGVRYVLECIDSGRDSRASWARGFHPSTSHLGGFQWEEGAEKLQFKDLLCGTYKLSITPRGHSSESFHFGVTTKGFEKSLTFKPENGTIKGRLVDESTGKPVGGVRMLASNEYPGNNWWPKRDFMHTYLTTEADGSFTAGEMNGAGSSRYLWVNIPDYLPLENQWTAKADNENLGDVLLSRAGSVHGILTAGGVAVPGHEVEIWTPENPGKLSISGTKKDYHGSEFSGDGGVWKRAKLKPGTYLLRAGFTGKLVEVKAGEDTDAGTMEIERK